jgi:hypothetical protein
MTSRRGFLAGLAALALPAPGWAEAGGPAFLAAARQGEAFVLHGLSAEGASVFAVPLPDRGHAAAAHPSRPLAVAFARRPGTFALVIDCATGRTRHRLTPPEGRQFNGHGSFSPDGELLCTSEVVADTSQGKIGVWETGSFRRVGEWDAGGIGPHDIRRLPDGRLVVANGGIATDPQDRSKLNLHSMRPNLTLLSAEGAIADQVELPRALWQNSIRHLAIGAAGQVAFAMQWEGDPAEAVPQLGLWLPGQPPQLCAVPEDQSARMQGYAGSIAWSPGGMIALTSPRGGVVMVHAADGTHLATHARADICGVAPLGQGFIASDGAGVLWALDRAGLTPLGQGDAAWDNHLVAIG